MLLLQALAAAAVLAGPASPTLGIPVTKLYSSGNLNTPIPDASVLPLTLPVAVGATILDVNARVRLDHPSSVDMAIYVESPDGTLANLATFNGGPGDADYGSGSDDCSGTFTVFDDEAATSINDGTAPFAGTFKPETPPLSVFDGKRSDGTWRLLVYDTGDAVTGTLFCWQIEITLELCPSFEAVEANHFVGSSGSDTLTGTAKKDIVCAGGGDDVVTGSTGDDTLDGGAGTDRLIESGDVSFTLTDAALTGLGTDILSGIELASLTAGPGHNDLDASAFSGAVTLKGEGGDDVLIGGTTNDSLDGGGGFDLIVAAGNVNFKLSNTLVTGLGNDSLVGIEEAFLAGGPGSNTINASAFTGLVTALGGGGADSLMGGRGPDVLLGGRGPDHAQGGRGNDQVHGGRGDDHLEGGRGNDRLIGSQNIDDCHGGRGKDTFQGCEIRVH